MKLIRPVAAFLLASAIFTAGIFIVERGYWAFYNWPAFEFQPACGLHDVYPDTHPTTLRFLDGETSSEFKEFLTSSYTNYLHWVTTEKDRLTVRDGRLYLTLSEFYRFPSKGKGTDGQREMWFHWVASDIASKILARRKQEGLINEQAQKDFMIFRERWNMHYPMEPGECGFMEELIMKGGRFASE